MLGVLAWHIATESTTLIADDGAGESYERRDLLDEALRGIGRNVLNLQKMEGMLKLIVSATGKIGSRTNAVEPIKDFERSIKKRRKTINRRPMGHLVENLSKTLQSCDADQGETVGDDIGFGVEVSFRFEDEDFTSELSQALRGLVRERNDLIHKRLVSFDPRSVESCRELIRELEEQRARIEPQYEALSAIGLSLSDHFKQLKDFVGSESFADDLKRDQ